MVKYIRILFCMFTLFIGGGFSAYSQGDNWYSTPCSGGASYYKDFGLITPTGTSQGVGFNGTNYNTGTNALWKGSFSVTASQAHYCFRLNIFGSGFPYGGGCEVMILSKACGSASQTIKADFWVSTSDGGFTMDAGSSGSLGPGNQVTACGCWTSAAADLGQIYYLELSEGPGDGELFGASGAATVSFSYETGNYTCNASGNIVLPIELTNFTAEQLNTKTKLEWTTVSESNNRYFTVERSLDGKKFIAIGTVQGADNSNKTLNYSAFDEEPANGINYYRLKQTDYNGNYKYSEIIRITYLSEKPVLNNIHPNPATDNVSFNLYSPAKATGNVQIMDITGRVISNELQNISEGNQDLSTSLASLENGIYYLKVSIDELGYSHTAKIIKN